VGITINGNTISITDANIEVVNGLNEQTGVAYILITPEGGVGSLPFMAQGLPGSPTLFPSITMVEIDPLVALPDPNPLAVLIDAGGAGVPAKYSLEFYVHKGSTGIAGSPSIALASDLAAAPVLGVDTEKFTILYRSSDSKWVPTAQKVGDAYVPGTIAATAYDSTSPRLLASIAIPALPFDWRPRVFAQTVITGSDGATPTRVDLVARLNDAASGARLGYGKGLIGANAVGVQTVLLPTYLHNEAVPGAYAKVAALAPATIHLRAEQVAASSSSWSTPASPDTTFVVEVQPLI